MSTVTNDAKIDYALKEKIGIPELFVGREPEFQKFHKWINNIPRELSKSWALLGRRKSGKTAFVQRLFNQLWSANGRVIPFYFTIPESPIWYPDFAMWYYRTFASHYISFLERDPLLIQRVLTMAEIRDYGEAHSLKALVQDVNSMLSDMKLEHYGLVWNTAYRAPHSIAGGYDLRFLVMIDEFQYMASNIYARPDLSGEPIRGMPGSYHEVSESKVAPMLVTGSYVGWMVDIMSKHLEAGRLSHIDFSPYLTAAEGLQAVYTYAETYEEPITNETALQINELCMADPFFISCVIQSNCPERDLTTAEGVIEAVNFEVSGRDSELSKTWRDYIDLTVERINETYGKHLLLYLSKHNDRFWTPRELKKELNLTEDETTIHSKLLAMVKADLIEWGTSDIRFRGLQDGTLNLILRNRFEEEIAQHQPDLRIDFRDQTAKLRAENQTLKGKLRDLKGKSAEFVVANALRSRKRFRLSRFFAGVPDSFNGDTRLNIIDVRMRIFIHREDDKQMELDVVATASDERVLLVEVRNRESKTTPAHVQDFQEKVAVYRVQNPEKIVLGAFLSLGGFTQNAQEVCAADGIAWATDLDNF